MMEASTLHDFHPTEEDELGFSKGSLVKIIGMEDDPNWYKAEFEGKKGMVPANYIEMKSHPWYVPQCSRLEAELRLLEKDEATNTYNQPDGAFLLRQSENTPGQFSISVKEGSQVLHFRVMTNSEGKYFIWVCTFNSINELIEHHRTQSIHRTQTLPLKDFVWNKRVGGSGANGPGGSTNRPGPVERYCLAQFDFTGMYGEELTFRRGDRIKIVGEEDENWWMGELSNGRRGLFPSNYVEVQK